MKSQEEAIVCAQPEPRLLLLHSFQGASLHERKSATDANLRRADGTGTGAPGALLRMWLAAAAPHLPPRLRLVRALQCGGRVA